MARTPSPPCPTCARLEDVRRANREFDLGLEYGSILTPMKRLYARAATGTYEGVGWICVKGHVRLDADAQGESHVIIPTETDKVLCLTTGEVVPEQRHWQKLLKASHA